MLKVRDLHFSYGNNPVFRDVSFLVREGSLCGLFGPNGSGKSTLIKCCLKILKTHSGLVELAGKDLQRIPTPALAKMVSYVPQDHTPPFPFLVRELVLMGRAPHFGGVFGVSARDEEIVNETLHRLKISHLANKIYTQLSGGQRQLVLIARAIAQDAPLIVLDEPTASLDFKNQVMIWDVLRRVVASGKTVLACAHDPNHVVWFCDDVVVLNGMGIAGQGDPRQVIEQELLTELYGNVSAVGELAGFPMVYPRSVILQQQAEGGIRF